MFEDITKPNVRGPFCQNYERMNCSSSKIVRNHIRVRCNRSIKSKQICGYIDRKELSVFHTTVGQMMGPLCVAPGGINSLTPVAFRARSRSPRRYCFRYVVARLLLLGSLFCRQHPIFAVSQYSVCNVIETVTGKDGGNGRTKRNACIQFIFHI